MKLLTSILFSPLLLHCILFTSSCSGAGSFTSQVIFGGTTPSDELIKSLLTIHSDSKVDFIRWNLILNNSNSNQNTFSLAIVFGESQPNTLGFRGGGEKLSFQGEYTVSPNKSGNLNGEIYRLKSSRLPVEILLLRLNDNLLHLLNPQKQLMVGNGGWSYTLNRIKPVTTSSDRFVSQTPASLDTATATDTVGVFDGRTICNSVLLELNEVSAAGCQRIKWRLTLHLDPKTHAPTTFQLNTVYVGTGDSVYTKTGNWEVIQRRKTDSNTFVYLLKPNDGKPKETLALLKADDNILFFMDKDWNLMVGEGNHSYTLNRVLK